MKRLATTILIASVITFAESMIDFNLSTQKAIKIETPYEMSKTIDLNKGVCFVIPDGEKYLHAANELKDFLSDRGIKDITFSNDKDFAKRQNNIIAIGDINSNFMIERLYWNWYTPMVPGVLINSYAIQTVFSPIGVYPQGDVLVLGVSNVDALPQLVEDFKAFIEDKAEDNKLTPYYRLYGKAVAQFRESFFEQFKNAGGLYGFTMLLDYYWRNMDERYFDTALEVLLERAEQNKQDPAMLKVDWNDELNCYKMIQSYHIKIRDYSCRIVPYFRIEKEEISLYKEKIPYMERWWEEHFEMIMNYNLNEKHFNEIVEKDVYLRNGLDKFISIINENKIQFLIFSAGLGNVIERVFKGNNWLKENICIISNFYFFDENGDAIGFNKNLIHVFNKNESQIPEEYKKIIREKNNLILIGDSLSDADMSEGLDHENIIKIGFMNDEDQEMEEEYLKNYDVVITNDSDFGFINELLDEIIIS